VEGQERASSSEGGAEEHSDGPQCISRALLFVFASVGMWAYMTGTWVSFFPNDWTIVEAHMDAMQAKANRQMFYERSVALANNKQRPPEERIFTPEAEMDLVLALPGLRRTLPFLQFAGYLDVTPTKHMFYWFVESEKDPINDPIVFWTNGGPGCSGFIGMMAEMGPFRPLEDLTLGTNEYAWNKEANMVFIEQPCGVGFSYSDNKEEDYKADDSKAANDNLQLVLKFLDKYPQYKTNEVYIAAESYGGHYLPTWAKAIVDYNSALAKDNNNSGRGEGEPEQSAGNNGDANAQNPDAINFRGFMVGNPYTDPTENMLGMYGTFWGHQLIPQSLYQEWYGQCFDSDPNKKAALAAFFVKACWKLEDAMWNPIDDMDPYALDYNICLDEKNSGKSGRSQRKRLLETIHNGRFAQKALSSAHQFAQQQSFTELSELNEIVMQLDQIGKLEQGGIDPDMQIPPLSPAASGSASRSSSMSADAIIASTTEADSEDDSGDLDPEDADDRSAEVERVIEQTAEEKATEQEGGLWWEAAMSDAGEVVGTPEQLAYNECTENYVIQYLNLPKVKKAIHANPDLQWHECSNKVEYKMTEEDVPMEPIYKELLDGNNDLKIMIFSGDDDSICGTIGTQHWISKLGYSVTRDWQPWYFDGQVAGFEIRYDGFRLATVHGAGHEVPSFRPGPALKLLVHYLEDSDLSS